jgi:hypothetical protein
MSTDFKNYGVPGFTSASRIANPALLFSNVPAFGGIKKVAVTAPIAKHALIQADGTLATYTVGAPDTFDDGIGVTTVEITQDMIDNATALAETVYVTYATSGNFLFEGLVLDASVDTVAKAQAILAAAGDNMLVNSNRYAGA